MSKMEIFLLACAIAMPFLSLLLVVPKRKKKEKVKKSKEIKTLRQIEQDNSKQEDLETKPIEIEENQNLQTKTFEEELFSDEELKEFVANKKEKLSKPKAKEVDEDLSLTFDDFLQRRRKVEKKETKPQSFNDLSPELKAMMITGVFNKKYFD